MWDLRRLSTKGNKPLHAMTHGRSVSSAYFSPLTGSHILTCSADDTLKSVSVMALKHSFSSYDECFFMQQVCVLGEWGARVTRLIYRFYSFTAIVDCSQSLS